MQIGGGSDKIGNKNSQQYRSTLSMDRDKQIHTKARPRKNSFEYALVTLLSLFNFTKANKTVTENRAGACDFFLTKIEEII